MNYITDGTPVNPTITNGYGIVYNESTKKYELQQDGYTLIDGLTDLDLVQIKTTADMAFHYSGHIRYA